MSNEPVVMLPKRIAEILIRYDPMAIYFNDVDNADEYDREAEDIARGLPTCESHKDCLTLVYTVFGQYFSGHAGPLERYVELAAALWRERLADAEADH